jgi:hypothetical protein
MEALIKITRPSPSGMREDSLFALIDYIARQKV